MKSSPLRPSKSRLSNWWPQIILLLTFGIYFISLAPRLIRYTQTGISMGHPYLWSDWALHIAMANRFATVDPAFWFSDHPLFAGGKFTYGFLTNFISGMMMRLGVSLPTSFIVPTLFFFLALIYGLYYLARTVGFGAKTAILSIVLFFCSAGLGFINFITSFLENPSLSTLAFPTEEFSRKAEVGWLSGNMIVGLLLPQRAFLLGITLAVWALTILLKELKRRTPRPFPLVLAGVFAGLLPITHMHSFIALIVISLTVLGITRKIFPLAIFGLVSAAISIPLYLRFIAGGIENPDFFRYQLGWGFGPGIVKWLENWWFAWGLVLPLGGIGLVLAWRHNKTLLTALGLAGFILFVVGNIVLFQPLEWDNSKIFLWAYLCFVLLTAYTVSLIWRHQTWRFLTPALVIILTFTGALELIRLQRTDRQTYELSSAKDIALGQWAATSTHPLARFATAPTHHHPIMVWGARPIVMGYSAWALNFGFDPDARLTDLKTLYAGSEATPEVVRRLKVSYVAVGPAEHEHFNVNESYFSQFPIVFSNQSATVYDVRLLAEN